MKDSAPTRRLMLSASLLATQGQSVARASGHGKAIPLRNWLGNIPKDADAEGDLRPKCISQGWC